MHRHTILSISLISLLSQAATATHDNEHLFDSDFFPSVEDVNEGTLVFLKTPPEKTPHQVDNTITITQQSLRDGWAVAQQCHSNIDALNNVQITYNSEMTRHLKILSFNNIENAWVENGNVELRNIKDHAKICVQYESKALHFNRKEEVLLRSGPYMRRFLDGYYPVHVNLKVGYPCNELYFIKTNYPQQAGYDLKIVNCTAALDAWFEGKLISELTFARRNSDSH